jgi:hypothetical protein
VADYAFAVAAGDRHRSHCSRTGSSTDSRGNAISGFRSSTHAKLSESVDSANGVALGLAQIEPIDAAEADLRCARTIAYNECADAACTRCAWLATSSIRWSSSSHPSSVAYRLTGCCCIGCLTRESNATIRGDHQSAFPTATRRCDDCCALADRHLAYGVSVLLVALSDESFDHR